MMAAAFGLAGCGKPPEGNGGAPASVAQVIAVEARRQPMSETLSLVGSLTANEMVEIKSETDGAVDRINFAEGQRVEKSQILIQLDESKFGAALAEAEANFKLSQANYLRGQQLSKANLISQQEFEQMASMYQAQQAGLDLKKRQLKDARIYAPFAGIMGSRQISPGQVIARNTTLAWLVDLDIIKAEFNVPERFLGQLRVGQKLDINVVAYPGDVFEGGVYFIAPQVDPALRTVLVKARIQNSTGKLKPGMFANLDLTLRLNDHAIVIPESAVSSSGERNIIFIIDQNETAQIVPVRLGVRQAGVVEVVSGLQGGERVIAEGLQKIRPGGKVSVRPPETAPSRAPATNAPAAKQAAGTGPLGRIPELWVFSPSPSSDGGEGEKDWGLRPDQQLRDAPGPLRSVELRLTGL